MFTLHNSISFVQIYNRSCVKYTDIEINNDLHEQIILIYQHPLKWLKKILVTPILRFCFAVWR